MLEGTVAWELFPEVTRGERGSPPGGNNPEGLGGRTGKSREQVDDRDTITVNKEPERKPDYSRAAPTGNSVSCAVRRLSRERPDLLARVEARAPAWRQGGVTMAPRVPSLFAALAGKAGCCTAAGFGLALTAAGATKPFPGFGLLMAGGGVVAMALLAAEFWREAHRRDRPPDGEPPE
jgi:hypothetical protein